MSTPSAAFVPEIIGNTIDEVDATIKVAALYFPRVLFNLDALTFPLLAVTPVGDRIVMRDLDTESRPGLRKWRQTLKPLIAEGVVVETGSMDHPKWPQALAANRAEVYRNLPYFYDKFRAAPGSDQRREIESKMLDILAPTFAAMTLTSGVPTAANREIADLYNIALEKASTEWGQVAPPNKARIQRDALAFGILRQRLPNVDDLSFPDILELRHLMRDNLLAFRAHIADIGAYPEAQPHSAEFDAYLTQVVENKIDPAVSALRRQLDELRRAPRLKLPGAVPAAASFATMMAGFVSHPEIALPVGAVSFLSSAIYEAIRARAERGATVAAHPLSLFIELPATSGKKRRKR